MNLLQSLFKRIFVMPFYQFSSASISSFDKAAYEHEIVRGIIDTIATHAAKAEAMHVIVDDHGRVKEIKRNSPYAKLLNFAPNDLMTGYDLKYRLFSQLEQYTTSFCYVRWNGIQPEMILPIDYLSAKVIRLEKGYAIEFFDADGNQNTLNLEDVIILRKLFGNGQVMGDGNKPVQNTLDMIKASDDGLMQALSISNKVRGLIRQKKSMLAPEDVTKNTEDFTKRFNAAAKNGGIVGVDSTEDFVQLNAHTFAANGQQMSEIKKNLFRYWHVSEAIVTGDYNDTQFQAFYESVVEARLICAALALTNGFFTKTEKNFGNRIIFNTSMLMHSSMATKINVLREARETGLFTINEQRELFNYPPVEGGDDRQVSLNYVKAKDQAKYQTGDNEEEGGDENGQEQSDGTKV